MQKIVTWRSFKEYPQTDDSNEYTKGILIVIYYKEVQGGIATLPERMAKVNFIPARHSKDNFLENKIGATGWCYANEYSN